MFFKKKMTLSLSYKGEISPFGRDDKTYERWPRDKTIVFQEFLWGFDEHNEAESTKDVKKALVDSMPEICSSGCSEEQGGGCGNALTRGALARKAEGAESI